MKTLITAGALVVVPASPAFAQQYQSQRAQAGWAATAQVNEPAWPAQPAQANADFTGDPRGRIARKGLVRGQPAQINPSAAAAFAQAPAPARAVQPAPFTGDTGYMGDDRGRIIWGGTARGQDPDAFIRSQISRGLGNYGAD